MKTASPRRPLRPHRQTGLGVITIGLAVATTGVLPASAAGSSPAGADGAELVRVVSASHPATGPTEEQSALRSVGEIVGARSTTTLVDAAAHPWQELTTLSGVVKDVDFVNRKVGYAAAELGVIRKTIDRGKTWARVVNDGVRTRW